MASLKSSEVLYYKKNVERLFSIMPLFVADDTQLCPPNDFRLVD